MLPLLKQLKELNTTKLIIFGASFLFIIIVMIMLFWKISSSKLAPIYTALDLKDSAEVVAELEALNVEYELKNNGAQILVPEKEVAKLRLDMARKGIPNKGSIVGYEIFDNAETFGTSQFMQNINLLRALEGELSRTIASIDNIAAARVHLVMPKKELFTRDRQEPSASIILQLKNTHTSLAKPTISAISNLVASAVPGLTADKITIVDSKGKALQSSSKSGEDSNYLFSTSEELRTNYERKLKNIIEELLEKSVGIGKAIAQISVEMNFDKIVTNSEIYDPDGQVARSVQSVIEKANEEDTEKNSNVSVENNLPNNSAQNQDGTSSKSSNERIDETTNYEISKTIRNTISETGTIKKLSIAVLIDGIYQPNAAGVLEYKPRSETELKQITSLVKSAVGFNEERDDTIEIVNMPFSKEIDDSVQEDATKAWINDNLGQIINTAIIVTVTTLFLVFVVKPVVNRAFEIAGVESEETKIEISAKDLASQGSIISGIATNGSFEEEGYIDIARLDAHLKSSSVKKINEVIEKYPEETINLIRKWLSEE